MWALLPIQEGEWERGSHLEGQGVLWESTVPTYKSTTPSSLGAH